MDADKQRILGYFIEEANEHLETLEKGILDLPAVVVDQERVNDMFRAAHSVKGGAAMLGFASIQKTSHRLEDYFKILKENRLKVDQKLVSMFLEVYKTLEELIKCLQGPFGLRPEEADKLVQKAEPTFVQLQNYLNSLMGEGGAVVETPTAPPPKERVAATNIQAPKSGQGASVALLAQTTGILKQMLQLFKQEETPASRKQLLERCNNLVQLGAGVETWRTLVQTSQKAIANPKNPYRILAPIVIKELKQASELLPAGKANAIAPSRSLQQLAAAASTQQKQILVTVEPRAAANALVQAFNKEQLKQLVELLQKATR